MALHEKDDEEKPNEKIPDRPLECGECKKPIAVHYTEVIGNSITHTAMCADCPELQKRLRGIPAAEVTDATGGLAGGLACGNCGTTLEALRVGAPLGCSECYTVFDDVLLTEMEAAGKIQQRLLTVKKTMPIHLGRAPGEIQEMNPSLQLLALNEALNETLKREDYEQAAWLRDQIKALENPENTDEGKQ
jgi:protein arginine kinase activator